MIRRMRLRRKNRGCPKNHPFTDVQASGIDLRGVPTSECLCGCRTFYAVIWLDDVYTVAGYMTTALCAECGALVTVATEIDHPEFERC